MPKHVSKGAFFLLDLDHRSCAGPKSIRILKNFRPYISESKPILLLFFNHNYVSNITGSIMGES